MNGQGGYRLMLYIEDNRQHDPFDNFAAHETQNND